MAPEGMDWQAARTHGAKLCDEGDYDAAIEALRAAIQGDESGESHALLGLAHFQKEEYGLAAGRYSAALERNPDNGDWQDIQRLAEANAAAEIHEPMPQVTHYQREALLAPPRPGTLPEGPAVRPKHSPVRLAGRKVGNVLGTVIGLIFSGITELHGRLTGYSDRVWTNWYRRNVARGMLTLAYMREQLNAKNLKSTYPDGSLIGFQARGQKPPPGALHYRTADGSWNNLDDPMEGAAKTRFPRNVANEAITPEDGDRLLDPNPRTISRKLLERGDEMLEVPFLNMLAAIWIQFQNHDWITHGDNIEQGMIEVPLDLDDPARERYRQSHMYVGRTQPDPTRDPSDVAPVTWVNEVTHWWDGSQIYGSDQETQDRLRSHVDGKLELHDDGTLPLTDKRVEDTGMVRNWWVGLSVMHLLFVKEHNAICDMLKAKYPDWDDNRLFNVARLINAAVMAKIHSVEWTPAILPNPRLDAALNANWYGILTNLIRKRQDRKTKATINVRNPEMGGVVGNPIDKHGSPYGLTQEFVEVYRLHSLLPEDLEIKKLGSDTPVEKVPFPASRQAGSRKLTEKHTVPDLLFSLGTQHPGQLVLNNYPTFMRELSVPGNPVFDMGAIDILRARERGVPRYNEFRRQLGLKPIERFEDLTDDKEAVAKIKEVYGDGPEAVEKLDLLVGTLSEGHRPFGFGFGETMFQIFILNATRRLQADRFYTDDYNEETYTPEGLDWIDRADLKRVLLRHYPELAQTGLANVDNAFEPWDTDTQLDKARHPLREYRKDLRPDPFVGDAHR